MYFSLKNFAKKNNISKKKAFTILNKGDYVRIENCTLVGSNKSKLNVYKKVT